MSTDETLQNPSKKTHGKKEALWLLSFCDMSLTLMCFFVVLIAALDKEKKRLEALLKQEEHKSLQVIELPNQQNILEDELQKLIEKENLAAYISILKKPYGLELEFKDSLFFAKGSAKLEASSKNLVKELSAILLKFYEKKVKIEGHTDDTAMIPHSKYESNLELSGARAYALVKSLISLGVKEEQFTVMALGSQKPKVSVEGLKGVELEEARKQNRRVVLLLTP